MRRLAIGVSLRQKGRRAKIITSPQNLPARIEAAVFPNNRAGKHWLKDGAPVDHFPVYLSLILSQREVSAVEKIRVGLEGYSKDQVRCRTAKNTYCNSIEFRCYFRDPAEVEKFTQTTLDGFNLVRSPCLGTDESKCPASLGQEARLAMRYSRQNVREPSTTR